MHIKKNIFNSKYFIIFIDLSFDLLVATDKNYYSLDITNYHLPIILYYLHDLLSSLLISP